MQSNSCTHLKDFMVTQMDVIKKHIDEHKYLRNIGDTDDALDSFIHDYGWLIRELYCTRICDTRCSCSISSELNISGDLLRNRVK